MIHGWDISREIAPWRLLLDLTDHKSILVQVMAWCRQATTHYLSQCWSRSMSPNGVTRPQWVLICSFIITTLSCICERQPCQGRTMIYFVECVSKIRHILSVIHYTIRGAVCFQFTHFHVMIERIYILCLIIIIKSEVWTITHCLGLGHETMVCAVCLFVFLWFNPHSQAQTMI